MKVRVSRSLYELYAHSLLNIRGSLDWILGYIDAAKSRQIPNDLLVLPDTDTVEVEITDYLLDQTTKAFGENRSAEAVVNWLLLMAYCVGGGE